VLWLPTPRTPLSASGSALVVILLRLLVQHICP